jgi:homocysteine S-methyltransferase
MTTYEPVPELSGELMLSDTGLETELIFHQGVDLPLFAAFVVSETPEGRDRIIQWTRDHADIAIQNGLGVALGSETWRASSDWGDQLGYDAARLDQVNQRSIEMLREIAGDLDAGDLPVRLGGTLGPRSDGYQPTLMMTAEQAQAYHLPQLRSFATAGADRATAMTLGYVAEAAGIARASAQVDLPVMLGFTVETDGRLPDGTTLKDAVERTDEASDGSAAGYLINCAHPDHLASAFADLGPWTTRLIGLRPNASRRSHAELDEAPDLDDGDPVELGRQVAELRAAIPSIALIGGCCGTDLRHAQAIAVAATPR